MIKLPLNSKCLMWFKRSTLVFKGVIVPLASPLANRAMHHSVIVCPELLNTSSFKELNLKDAAMNECCLSD